MTTPFTLVMPLSDDLFALFKSRVSPRHNEILLFRQKDPKPFSPVRVPAGSSASVPNKMARELAESILSLVEGLKQPSPERPIRDRGSAAPEGG